MKKLLITITFISVLMTAFILLSSFKGKKDTITFYAHNPVLLSDGTTYTGTVTAEGAINESGTNIMYTQVHGMALHCTIIMTFPGRGTLTIRMNCNMKTFNGRWKIIEGTGAYEHTKGEGSLVMPNEVDEILTGYFQ